MKWNNRTAHGFNGRRYGIFEFGFLDGRYFQAVGHTVYGPGDVEPLCRGPTRQTEEQARRDAERFEKAYKPPSPDEVVTILKGRGVKEPGIRARLERCDFQNGWPVIDGHGRLTGQIWCGEQHEDAVTVDLVENHLIKSDGGQYIMEASVFATARGRTP